MTAETDALLTIQDLVRWGGCQFADARLFFGHGTDNEFDEAAWLVAHALHLPLERVESYRDCHITVGERAAVLALLRRRITERRPAAYLTGLAWFAGLEFIVDDTVLIPRSPLAELIADGFAPWVNPEGIRRVLDLCTGSGCLGIALAAYLPDVRVDLADISPAALRVAARNRTLHGLDERVRIIESDLFASIEQACASPSRTRPTGFVADPNLRQRPSPDLERERTMDFGLHPDPDPEANPDPHWEQVYDIIVSNPPYVGVEEMESLPAEYLHEPRLALAAGETGLDLVLRILRDAPDYLDDEGVLIVEVGSTAATLQRRFPDVPFTWLDFERGGEGVLLLSREQLVEYHPRFSEAVADL